VNRRATAVSSDDWAKAQMCARHPSSDVRTKTDPNVESVQKIVFYHEAQFSNRRRGPNPQLQIERPVVESQTANRWANQGYGSFRRGSVRLVLLVQVNFICPVRRRERCDEKGVHLFSNRPHQRPKRVG
jgi:hypothetical protein